MDEIKKKPLVGLSLAQLREVAAECGMPAFAAKQMNVSELARICGLSRPTVYKYLSLISPKSF